MTDELGEVDALKSNAIEPHKSRNEGPGGCVPWKDYRALVSHVGTPTRECCSTDE